MSIGPVIPPVLCRQDSFVGGIPMTKLIVSDEEPVVVRRVFARTNVIQLTEKQVDSFLERDVQYQEVHVHLPIQNSLPTVTRFAMRGIYFTVVNYTQEKVVFKATDEDGEHPYRLLLNNVVSDYQFSSSDTLLIFYPGKSKGHIYSLSKGRFSFEPMQRIEWTIRKGAYEQYVLHKQIDL